MDIRKKLRFYKKKSRYISYAIISLICSYIIIDASNSEGTWRSLWDLLIIKIPTMWPPFIDLEHVRSSLICKLKGIDPFITNPCEFSETRYQYPIGWLIIFEKLNLQIYENFQFFLFFTISFTIFSYLAIFDLSRNNFNKIILIFLFFSTSSMLLLERGNVDHIIFSLTFLAGITPIYYLSLSLVSLTSLLKIYPFFSFFYLITKSKKIITLIFMICIILMIYEISISKYIDKNHSIMAMSQTYGVQSITEGFFKTFEKKNLLFINENEKNIIRMISSLLFLTFCITIFYFGTISKKNIEFQRNLKQKNLFILGGSIYVGSYIFYSNLDYRLVFLFLTIPFAYNFGKKINLVYCLSILIISNSWIFHFKPLSLEHIIFTSILYGIKLSLVIFISYYLGAINKNFFNIKKVELF